MTLYDEVRAALREADFRPRKSLGQNFLIHERVIDSILRLLDLDANAEVVEIGPGLGFLTRRLLDRASTVWAVEVDPILVERLRRSDIATHANFRLIHGDILEIPLPELLPQTRIRLVGNLPYSISTPVLFRILEWYKHFSRMVLMVQKEVADRIAGKPGTKDYGTLSVWCQIHGQITDKVSVSPEAFFPRLVRAAFGQRRKTLSNALSVWLKSGRGEIESFLHSQDIDPRRRGETLSVGEFVKLARAARNQSALINGTDH